MAMTYFNSTVTVCSYNSTGFGPAAQNYIDKLLVCSDILFIQEHFLLDCKDKKHSNTNKMREKFNSCHDMYIVPAVKDSSQVSKGRGVGGLATLWKKSLTKYVTRVETSNPRILASQFQFPDCPLLALNVYFPCDPRTSQHDLLELANLLSDIDTIVRSSGLNNVLLGGDLNCHFNRNTIFTSTIKDWLDSIKLNALWTLTDQRIENVDFTFCNASSDPIAFSTIDHFATSDRMLDGLLSAGVLHDGTNLSNHSAIYIKFETGRMDLKTEAISHEHIPGGKFWGECPKDNTDICPSAEQGKEAANLWEDIQISESSKIVLQRKCSVRSLIFKLDVLS